MKTRQTAIFAAGALAVVLAGAQTLNLNPHKTRAAKGDILNTAQIVTDVNMTGVSTSITAYVGQIVAPLANTQQLAEAVAPLATTQQVAAATAGVVTAVSTNGTYWLFLRAN